MPHPTAQDTPATLPIVAVWQRPALTARGMAAAHLSRFQDQWNDLTTEDRQWFAQWLRDLLIDACLEPAPSR